MSKVLIYSINCPHTGAPKYIGKTNDIKKRLCQHLANKRRNKLTCYLKSLKVVPPIEIIDEVNESEWAFWEQHYISLYSSWGFNLKNMTVGGEGASKYSHTDSAKLKIGASASKRLKGMPKSKEHGVKISIAKKGKPNKAVVSKYQIDLTKSRNKLLKSKSILKVSNDNKIIARFSSIREAMIVENNTNVGNIVNGYWKINPKLGYNYIYEKNLILEQQLSS